MLCPVCRFDNFEGEDTCANCGADLATSDVPQPAQDFHDTILGDHIDRLGLGSLKTVDPRTPVADAIRQMHEADTDCLLVTEGGQLVGIFTDRDAVVKVAGKRQDAFDVRDFMTPDPVVLRHDDTIAVAIHKMAVGEFRHLPIVEGGRPIGVVAAADLFRHLVDSLA
ncbi:MAG TPA: CBS domain-containing protein [Acidimicrobiales bacterium]|nr:CBS domain-containing protein [Acidimicrobiales bacterium]